MNRNMWHAATGLLLALTLVPVCLGQEAVETEEPASRSPQQQRAELADRLAAAQQALQAAQEEGAEVPKSLVEEIGLLRRLDGILAQQLNAEQRLQELDSAQVRSHAELDELRTTGLAGERPYSFVLGDQLRDELEAEQARKQALADAVAAVADALARAQQAAAQRDSDRRRAKEALETNQDEGAVAMLGAKLARAELEHQIAQETVGLRERELAAQRLAEIIHQLNIDLLQEKVAVVARDALFTRHDLDDILFELTRQQAEVAGELESARANDQYLERRWFDARNRLELAVAPEPALVEEVEARRVARQGVQQLIAMLDRRLGRFAQQRQAWERRFRLASDQVPPAELKAWAEDSRQALDELEREARLQAIRTDDVRNAVAALDRRLDGLRDQSEMRRWVEEQRSATEGLLRASEEETSSIAASRRLHEKLFDEIGTGDAALNAGRWAAQAWHQVVRIWNTEVVSIDDRPITVRKLVIGCLLLVLGFFLSRFLSHLFGRRFLARVLERSAAAALQTVLFYLLLVIFSLFALRFVHVPLTAFTILGGAVAIGVGFGSQNVVNNFISGLILLAERPVKVGDMIQLGDVYGNVAHIGARSTRIKTGEDFEIIVPNSVFLETNVVNWTLSSDRIRTHVKVGVAYGSPTELVTTLIERAATEHAGVLAEPRPFVWFADFGSSSLDFELHFWIEAHTEARMLSIRSDLRYRIDQLFRAAGVVIAFPQRDLHLDAARPLNVQVVAADESQADQEQPDLFDLLRRIDLFLSLSSDEIETLAREMKPRHLAAGTELVRQGEAGSSMFVVGRGLLEVTVSNRGTTSSVGRLLLAGQYCGEMSLLTGEPRAATVTAVCDTIVFELGHEVLRPLLSEHPGFAETLCRVVTERSSSLDRTGPAKRPTRTGRTPTGQLLRRVQEFFGLGR